MNTGSADERKYLADVTRIADALERVAKALEDPKPIRVPPTGVR